MWNSFSEEETYFTVDRLVGVPVKLLNYLGGYDPSCMQPTEAASNFFKAHMDTSSDPNGEIRPWTSSAQANALVAIGLVAAGERWGVSHIEEAVWPKGGQVEYSAATIAVRKPNGEVKSVENNPIPAAPELATRTGQQTVAIVLMTLFDLDKGVLTHIKQPVDWMIRFPDGNYPVKPAGIVKVKAAFNSLYAMSDAGQTHKLRNVTLKGSAWAQFLMPFLSHLKDVDYWMLASVITTDFFNVVTRRKVLDKKWVLIRYTDKEGESQSFVHATGLYVPSENQQKKDGLGHEQAQSDSRDRIDSSSTMFS